MNDATPAPNMIERYLRAATRENTTRSYAAATRHYEVQWGGFLPATADAICRYAAQFAGALSNNTLRHRLAALGRWHREHGFHDPTRDELVRRTLKGIRAVHGAKESQATPLQLTQLAQVVAHLEQQRATALAAGDRRAELQACRDRALVLLGFWRAFRSDELARLRVEDVTIESGAGMTLYLAQSKGDRENEGRTLRVPVLSRLCPVQATADWIACSKLAEGALFRKVNRWGSVSVKPLHSGSIIGILRRMLTSAGIAVADEYSSHSLRRGLAGWASANGWDVKTLMKYVGWKDVNSAMRYIDAAANDVERLEAGLAQLPSPKAVAAPTEATTPREVVLLELHLVLERQGRGRGLTAARREIEEICLARYGGQPFGRDGTRYQVRLDRDSEDGQLDERIADLLDELHRVAASRECYLEASLKDPVTGQCWD